MSKSLITNSVGRIGRFALSFNFEVNFNLLRRGRKCSELDARQLLVRWELLNCKMAITIYNISAVLITRLHNSSGYYTGT